MTSAELQYWHQAFERYVFAGWLPTFPIDHEIGFALGNGIAEPFRVRVVWDSYGLNALVAMQVAIDWLSECRVFSTESELDHPDAFACGAEIGNGP